jgi:hypothetical protein
MQLFHHKYYYSCDTQVTSGWKAGLNNILPAFGHWKFIFLCGNSHLKHKHKNEKTTHKTVIQLLWAHACPLIYFVDDNLKFPRSESIVSWWLTYLYWFVPTIQPNLYSVPMLKWQPPHNVLHNNHQSGTQASRWWSTIKYTTCVINVNVGCS